MGKGLLFVMWFVIICAVGLASRPIAFAVGSDHFPSINLKNFLDTLSFVWTFLMFFHAAEYLVAMKNKTSFFSNSLLAKLINALRVFTLFAATVIFSNSKHRNAEFFEFANFFNPLVYVQTLYEFWQSNIVFFSALYIFFLGVAFLPYIDFEEGETESYEVVSIGYVSWLFFAVPLALVVGVVID